MTARDSLVILRKVREFLLLLRPKRKLASEYDVFPRLRDLFFSPTRCWNSFLDVALLLDEIQSHKHKISLLRGKLTKQLDIWKPLIDTSSCFKILNYFIKYEEKQRSHFVSTEWQAFLWTIYTKFWAKLVGVKDSLQLPEKLRIFQ